MTGSFTSNHSNGFGGVAALRKVGSGTDYQKEPYLKDSLKIPPDRKKAGPLYIAARKWVKVDQNGVSSIIQAEKNELTQQLGVQLRDLRVLDPYLAASYPSAILSRDKALVVNLEHIKCIIATDHILVTNAEDDTVLAFVEELQRRCSSSNSESPGATDKVSHSSPDLVVLGDKGDMTKETMYPFLEIPFELRVLEVVLESVCSPAQTCTAQHDALCGCSAIHSSSQKAQPTLLLAAVRLAASFRTAEHGLCWIQVCSHLERLTSELEAAAHPALDALTSKVRATSLDLQGIREPLLADIAEVPIRVACTLRFVSASLDQLTKCRLPLTTWSV